MKKKTVAEYEFNKFEVFQILKDHVKKCDSNARAPGEMTVDYDQKKGNYTIKYCSDESDQ